MSAPPDERPLKACVSCGQMQMGRFCAACGEKRLEPGDLSWTHLALHFLSEFTHADGKMFRTFRRLLFQPGRLTADYLRGKRKPYLAPLPLFLLCNLIFFLLQPLVQWSSLTTPLRLHLDGHPYSVWIRPWWSGKLRRCKSRWKTTRRGSTRMWAWKRGRSRWRWSRSSSSR